MKKKTIKKLHLNRETLAKLDELDLQPVVGASQPRVCTFSALPQGCGTGGGTCTTNYC